MAKMNYSNDAIKFANDLVCEYAKWNSKHNSYLLILNDIPDFELNKFAVKLMSEDLVLEAISPDNPSYNKDMLPTLLKYLNNSTDRDEEIEFVRTWRESITSYFYPHMQKLIDDVCNTRLHTEMYERGFYPNKHRDNGEIYWSRI